MVTLKECSGRTRERPYIIINCAMSLDGKIALPTKKQVKLSSLEDFKRVHELRNYCDAVLVGVNTVLIDNPNLTVKPEYVLKPKNPIRIILDTHGRVEKDALVFNGKAPTYIVMGDKYSGSGQSFPNSEILFCPVSEDGCIDLFKLVVILRTKGIENILVEGGGTVIYSFIKNRLFDEISIYMSPKIIGGANTPTMVGGEGFYTEDELVELRLYSFERLGDGILIKYLKK